MAARQRAAQASEEAKSEEAKAACEVREEKEEIVNGKLGRSWSLRKRSSRHC
jgi:hypothetical protein